jgi:hypothetical protein
MEQGMTDAVPTAGPVRTAGTRATAEPAAPTEPAATGPVLTVGGPDAHFPGFHSQAIQRAADALARSGGTILLAPGIYEIEAPVRLYSRQTLAGSGEATVLRKGDGVVSRLALDPGFGQLWVDVEDASRFRPGMGVLIRDTLTHHSFMETAAIITAVAGNRLMLDRRLNADYDTDAGATASNACSIVEAIGAERVVVRDLVVDGNRAANAPIGGCRGGGVYFREVTDSLIARVRVRNFNGDGISWQITERIRVEGCEVSGCAGNGLHPGARSVHTAIVDCTCRDNDGDGLFVCWMVQHGRFERNRFIGNGRDGISIGHQDTDNVFRSNLVSDNGRHGIYARREKPMNGAHRNRYEGNVIENNGRREEGAGIYIEGVTRDWRIEDNDIRNTAGTGQAIGVYGAPGAACIVLAGNRMAGHRKDAELAE